MWVEVGAAAHHQGGGLIGAPLAPALLQQVGGVDQAGAAVQAQGASTDQAGIRPGQRFLEHAPVAGATDLGGAPFGWGQAAIEADRQNKPDLGKRSRSPLRRLIRLPRRAPIRLIGHRCSGGGQGLQGQGLQDRKSTR